MLINWNLFNLLQQRSHYRSTIIIIEIWYFLPDFLKSIDCMNETPAVWLKIFLRGNEDAKTAWSNLVDYYGAVEKTYGTKRGNVLLQ